MPLPFRVRILYFLIDLARLFRLTNCLIAVIGTLVGAYLTGDDWLIPSVYRAAGAVLLLCAAGNALNDLMDIETDRISHPKRVLVSGRISPILAAILSILLGLAGLVLLFSAGNAPFEWGVAGAIAILLYDVLLKRVVLLGNLMVALSAGLTFMVGAAAANPTNLLNLPGPVLPALLAILYHFVREVVKDVEDLDGDQAVGIRKLPSRIGVRPSLLVGLGVLIILTILTSLPFFFGWFGVPYLVLAIGLGELPSIAMVAGLTIAVRPRLLRFTAAFLKVGMVLGLAALLFPRR